MTNEKSNTVKAVSFMMIITLVGKILGLVRDQFLASNYAMGMEASAFLTASRIPRIFFDAVFASAISASFIPIFNEYMNKKGKEEAFTLSSNFITLIAVFTTILTVLGIVFAPWLTAWFADGFDAQTAELCTNLLRILFPATIFTGIAFSLVGILQSMDEFNIPAAMSIASNLVIIFYYIFFNETFGIYGLTFAFLAGWAMQAVIQLPSLRKKGYRYRPIFNLKDEGIKKIGILMLPVMISTWIQPINLAINTKFASRILEGAGVSAIEYANTVYSIIVGVFVLSIANVIFPKLSRMTIRDGNREFGDTISATMEIMFFLLIPMMAGLMCLSEPITSLIYKRGQFGDVETAITAKALFYFSIGMLGFGVQTILSRAFYAQQNGKTPLVSGVISIIVNILLCITLAPSMGVGGLALASAISSVVSAIILLLPMQKQSNIVSGKFITEVFKMTVSAIIMTLVVIFIKNTIENTLGSSFNATLFTVAASTGAGIIVYMVISYFFRVGQVKQVMNIAIKFMKGKISK